MAIQFMPIQFETRCECDLQIMQAALDEHGLGAAEISLSDTGIALGSVHPETGERLVARFIHADVPYSASTAWIEDDTHPMLPVCDATMNATVLGHACSQYRALRMINRHLNQQELAPVREVTTAQCRLRTLEQPQTIEAWVPVR